MIWFNPSASNSTTGELDMDALNFNGNTYYVGFDANQGAELGSQGRGLHRGPRRHHRPQRRRLIGYVLAIGDIGHNDSIARTRGVRTRWAPPLTAKTASCPILSAPTPTAPHRRAGRHHAGRRHHLHRARAGQPGDEDLRGATWDAPTAGNAISTWAASFGDQIDIGHLQQRWHGHGHVQRLEPGRGRATFGYDANADAVAAIADGYGGTISQHADVQAYLTLRLIRNALDGVDINTALPKRTTRATC